MSQLDVVDLLSELRRENRENHRESMEAIRLLDEKQSRQIKELDDKFDAQKDDVVADTQDLDLRVSSLESSRRLGAWLTGTAIATSFTAIANWIFGGHKP